MNNMRGVSVAGLGGVLAPIDPTRSNPPPQVDQPTSDAPNFISDLSTFANLIQLVNNLLK